jgi:hypothetical protein
LSVEGWSETSSYFVFGAGLRLGGRRREGGA